MVERDGEPLAATVLGDQRAVVMRPLSEEDQAALLAFGAALPQDDLLYLEDEHAGWAVFFGRRGVMRDRAFQDQMHQVSCLLIVMAAIIAWNTVYLMDAITILRAKGEDIPDGLLPHLAPLGWRHIKLLERYEFHGLSYSLSQRRPLRTEAAGELDVPLDDEPETEAGAW
jgi:hypothetical protein